MDVCESGYRIRPSGDTNIIKIDIKKEMEEMAVRQVHSRRGVFIANLPR